MKLAGSPRSLSATLAALPSISEIPFLDSVHSVPKRLRDLRVFCGENVGAIHLNSEGFRELEPGGGHQDEAPIPSYLAKDCAILGIP